MHSSHARRNFAHCNCSGQKDRQTQGIRWNVSHLNLETLTHIRRLFVWKLEGQESKELNWEATEDSTVHVSLFERASDVASRQLLEVLSIPKWCCVLRARL